jgi:hypothetical protein
MPIATGENLALPERFIERVVDRLHVDPEARGRIPVDLEGQRRARDLVVGCRVAELGNRLRRVRKVR